jgi:hypothetical protein
MPMMMTILDIDSSVDEWFEKPAVTSRGKMYLVENNTVIGKVRTASAICYPNGLYERVSIQPDDEATREFFKNDPGMIDGGLYGVKYNGVTGDRYIADDEDPNTILYTETRVVDCFDFEWGLCHSSFKDVVGFDSYHREQNKLRIHTTQKHRRRRKTHKIKNAA